MKNVWIFLGKDSELNGDILEWITIVKEIEFPSTSATEVVNDDDDEYDENRDQEKSTEPKLCMVTVRARTPEPPKPLPLEPGRFQNCTACGWRWKQISNFPGRIKFRTINAFWVKWYGSDTLSSMSGWNLGRCKPNNIWWYRLVLTRNLSIPLWNFGVLTGTKNFGQNVAHSKTRTCFGERHPRVN